MAEGKAYFCSFWNIIDVLGLLLVVYVLISTGLGLGLTPLSALRVIAAFGSCFTLIKLFDWLRLFEDTAFYVLLVAETLKDIRYFLLPESLPLETLLVDDAPKVRNKKQTKGQGAAGDRKRKAKRPPLNPGRR